MSYNVSYTTIPGTFTTNTSAIGYYPTATSGTATNIPTGGGTVNVPPTTTVQLTVQTGIWLIIANLQTTSNNNANSNRRLSLSTTSGTIDANFVSGITNNGAAGALANIQVSRVVYNPNTSSTNIYLVFFTLNGENSSSGDYDIQYLRLA